MGHLVRYWVGMTLICYVPPSCQADQPGLPISYQPKQNQADDGTDRVKVDSTQQSEQMFFPVLQFIYRMNQWSETWVLLTISLVGKIKGEQTQVSNQMAHPVDIRMLITENITQFLF